jgi:hypothetical protein
MNIRQERGKNYKKFKPCGAKITVLVILLLSWSYILFEVIRG